MFFQHHLIRSKIELNAFPWGHSSFHTPRCLQALSREKNQFKPLPLANMNKLQPL